MSDPLGKASVEPDSAFQMPAVSVLAVICAILAERLSVPESASIVPVLLGVPFTRMVDVPVPAVFSIVPSFTIEVWLP